MKHSISIQNTELTRDKKEKDALNSFLKQNQYIDSEQYLASADAQKDSGVCNFYSTQKEKERVKSDMNNQLIKIENTMVLVNKNKKIKNKIQQRNIKSSYTKQMDKATSNNFDIHEFLFARNIEFQNQSKPPGKRGLCNSAR